MTLPRIGISAPAVPPSVDADPLASPRIRALALEIAYRLRPVCGHLPEGELVRLVTRLAVAQHQANASAGPTAT
ncbi:MAG TPA: hypothetical protein VFY85_12785 [Gemmatimonadaceae bacterium]|nr:hypothetical protein [Gemmatimonadaceae bacterium]